MVHVQFNQKVVCVTTSLVAHALMMSSIMHNKKLDEVRSSRKATSHFCKNKIALVHIPSLRRSSAIQTSRAMRFTTAALSSLSLWVAHQAHVANAFGVPSRRAFARAATTKATSTQLHANVLKLSDPTRQILDKTDVFIFDCDGVIWRVRAIFRIFCFVVLWFTANAIEF